MNRKEREAIFVSHYGRDLRAFWEQWRREGSTVVEADETLKMAIKRIADREADRIRAADLRHAR